MLLAHAISHAGDTAADAVTLTTFRTPPWNGPWFRGHGFEPMPDRCIGPMLRGILDGHSRSFDMSTRETLWRPTPSERFGNRQSPGC
jgi:hypothetical protein